MEHHMQSIVPFPARAPHHAYRDAAESPVREPAERHGGHDLEGPGRSWQSVGHRAKAAVAEAIEMGYDLPANAIGKAASNGGVLAESFFMIMVEVDITIIEGGEDPGFEISEPGDDVEAPDDVAEMDDVDEGAQSDELDDDADIADADDLAVEDVAMSEEDGDIGDPEADMGADLANLADAALNLYEMTQNILQSYNLNAMETALELLTGAEEADQA